MMRLKTWTNAPLAVLLLLALSLWAGPAVLAQQAAPEGAAAPDVEAAPAAESPMTPRQEAELALEQGRLADKYKRLEELMLKMAELEGSTNPKRAALLARAVEQSKERLTKTQLEAVVKLLSQNNLKRAIDGQSTVQTDLKALLELLNSEDRSNRLKSEQQRIREYIKEVERLIRLERSIQGQTEGGTDERKLAEEQARIADQTGQLAKKIQENEEGTPPGEAKPGENEGKPGDENQPGKDPMDSPGSESGKPGEAQDPMEGKPSEGKPSEGKPSEGQPSEGKPSEGKPSEGKPGEQEPGEQKPGEQKPGDEAKPNEGDKPAEDESGEQKPGEEKPGEQKPGEAKPSEGKPSEGEPSEGKPSEGKPSEGSPMPGESGESGESQSSSPPPPDDQNANPARKRLEQAQQKMRDAQQKLEEAKRKESAADQQAAREELEKAKAELEEILRQLREEEIGRTLAMLEARFRKMLEMQLAVYESTGRLDKLPAENRGESFLVQTGRLSVDQRKIAIEAQKALTLLQEEGSSVAFPATVEVMHEDMVSVAERLADAKVDDITIGTEEDIIESLEELIAALQKAQQDLEEQQQQQQQQQQQEQEQPLVDEIAELKMIKALQERVNKRTVRYARLLDDDQDLVGQAETDDLVQAIRALGERQQEVYRITRDIVLGKNK
jgi:hypothetical protein